ncbi:MAG: hypothetical protein O2807_00385 [bacterium]|nr:hypothetical protein [bacterium]
MWRKLLSLVFFLLMAAGAGALLQKTPEGRHPVDGMLLLQAVFSGEGGSWLAQRPAPRREAAALAGGELDIYLPESPPGEERRRGCVLLAHGMTDRGRRDPRIVLFARALGRLGFVVAVPELAGMVQFRPEAADADRMEAAFLRLDEKYAAPQRACGMFAFSFAAGPAMQAAGRPALRGKLGYFIAFGAYFELTEVIRHLTTSGRDDQPAFPGGPPVRLGKWLFLRHNPDLLGLESHPAEIEAIVRRKLISEVADVNAIKVRLPNAARRVIGLLENRDPKQFEALLAGQAPALRARMSAWSMAGPLAETRMPLFLLHGKGDPFVPPRESQRLAAAARRRADGGPVRLLVLEGFDHVDPLKTSSLWNPRQLWEVLRLLGFASAVLTRMEGG